MTPPFGTSVALDRGWVRGGGVFLISATLLLASGCAMRGDVRRLQEEVALQSSQQETQVRALSDAIRALQDTLNLQSDMVVDTRGGIALSQGRETRSRSSKNETGRV
jgi:hypothetical protein